MNHPIERARLIHQEIEIIEQAIVNQYHQPRKTYKEKLQQEHQVASYLNHLQSKQNQLDKLYDIEQKDLDSITGVNDFGNFYKKLKALKETHSQTQVTNLVEPLTPQLLSAIGSVDIEKQNLFSGEENYGRYLDLHNNYNAYFDLQIEKDLSYLEYLNKITKFIDIPINMKEIKYSNYLQGLVDYLKSFFNRTRPLFDWDNFYNSNLEDMKNKWNNNQVEGWPFAGKKELFCSACNKTFTKDTVYTAHLTGKKHLKNVQNNNTNNDQQQNNVELEKDPKFNMALYEALIVKCFDELSSILLDTITNVERKQSLTERERQYEQEEEIIEEELVESSEDETDERIYNPLKLPLGWDGKPIPYWLYKLHGLGVEYPCEICGNFVYMGRKAFERHFQEWRHAHGMRCLGIPNTKHFNEITSIQDAYSLWEKLKQTAKQEIQTLETLEEFEDASGNVYNKKTYEDLKRQGII